MFQMDSYNKNLHFK